MLTSLSVKNFALLEDALLEFPVGFNVLTGETGAGKSILLDALGLALGRRADAGQVRAGTPRLSVTAAFRLDKKTFGALFDELHLTWTEDECLLRREVESGGRSRAFVNDEPVSLGTLSRLGERLAEAHGQHEHQRLLKPAAQRELVDAFGGLDPLTADVAAAHRAWKNLLDEQEALSLSEQERAQRLDLYRYQKQELDAADPAVQEEEELERLLPQLKNAERLKSLAEEAHSLLYEQESSALELVRRVQRDLEGLRGLGADVSASADLLDQALVNLEEVSRSLEGYVSGMDLDPRKLEEALTRLDLLARLKKKYGPALSDVVAYRGRVAGELDRLENLEGKNRDLSRQLSDAAGVLKARAGELTKARAAAARKLTAAVNKEFREVGLSLAALDIALTPLEGPSAAGAEEIVFYFTPNPGEGKQPLADVASGGELSRVMLSFKSVLAKADPVPVLIFDEIDAGVGGALGGVLGKKLAKLGTSHQVLSVTHLATIAACADAQFFVEKTVHKDRTKTTIRLLTEEERAPEIARLFGTAAGTKDDPVGLKHARELLESSRR